MSEVDRFLDHLTERDYDRETVRNYRSTLNRFAAWFEKSTGQPFAPANVTPLDLRQYRENCKTRYRPATVNGQLIRLNGFFRWAMESGLVDANPLGKIKRLKNPETPPKWFTRQEVYRLLRTAQQQRQLAQVKGLDYSSRIATRTLAMLVLLLNTGLRVTELCSLLVGDVELGERSGLLTVRYGKGQKRRQLPLNVDARRALRAWLKVRPAVEGDYLFPGDEGGQLTRQAVCWHLKRLGKAAGLKLNPHALRHTFAKNLTDSGVQLDRVAALLGHSSINTTGIYTKPGLQDLEGEVIKIQWED